MKQQCAGSVPARCTSEGLKDADQPRVPNLKALALLFFAVALGRGRRHSCGMAFRLEHLFSFLVQGLAPGTVVGKVRARVRLPNSPVHTLARMHSCVASLGKYHDAALNPDLCVCRYVMEWHRAPLGDDPLLPLLEPCGVPSLMQLPMVADSCARVWMGGHMAAIALIVVVSVATAAYFLHSHLQRLWHSQSGSAPNAH